MAVRPRLREVFVNMIVNAVDAMPRGGSLLITCRRIDNRLQLNFSDNGVGMPDDVQQKDIPALLLDERRTGHWSRAVSQLQHY